MRAMARGALALGTLAVAIACGEPEAAKDKVAQTAEKAQELGDKAADKVEDVAQDVVQKTAGDAKIMARETAEEAKRVAGKAADAADQASDRIDDRVDQAGERVKTTAEVVAGGPPTPAPPHEVREAMLGADEAIDCDGKGRCTVQKTFAERLRAQPEVVVTQARLEPAPSGGFTLQSIGDLPTKLGFENGDVITSVNGVDLARKDAMAELMLQLGGTHFEVAFVRSGTEQTLQIDVV